jgi:hypothetical protein
MPQESAGKGVAIYGLRVWAIKANFPLALQASTQANETEQSNDDHNRPDDINDLVHGFLP